MGVDFGALLRYGGPAGKALEALVQVESGWSDPALSAVIACGLRHDFSFARRADRTSTCWRRRDDWDVVLPERPPLPALWAALDMPSGFDLTFGHDAIWVYHLLRWSFFIECAEWQPVMINAVRAIGTLFEARECVIMSDWHPSLLAFLEGASFSDCLQRADERGEGEVATIREMYREKWAGGSQFWEPHGYWRLL